MIVEKIREESDRSILRLNNEAFLIIKRYSIIKKVASVMSIASHYIPIPRVIEYGRSVGESGYLFLEAVGDPQSEKVIEREPYLEILRCMRCITSKDHSTVRDYMRAAVDKVRDALSNSISETFIETIFESVSWDKYSICLNHGDLHPENVILNKDGTVAGVIDWEYATYAPEFIEESLVWLYHPDILSTTESYPQEVILLSILQHIVILRPGISQQCISLVNSQLALPRDATTKPQSGMVIALSTLLVLLANKVRDLI